MAHRHRAAVGLGDPGHLRVSCVAALGADTVSATTDLLSALSNLVEVCQAMDADNQDERPTDEAYQDAIARAQAALAVARAATVGLT